MSDVTGGDEEVTYFPALHFSLTATSSAARAVCGFTSMTFVNLILVKSGGGNRWGEGYLPAA